jgi:hypothetical protein
MLLATAEYCLGTSEEITEPLRFIYTFTQIRSRHLQDTWLTPR